MLDGILLVFFTLAFLGLVGLLLHKLPILKVIDVSQVDNLKQQQVKHELVDARLKRKLTTWSKKLKKYLSPLIFWERKIFAWFYSQADRWEKSIEQKIAVQTAPEKLAAAALAKAQSLRAGGKLKEAENIYLQFISQHPGRLDAYEGLAEIYLDQRDYEEAREVYEYLANKGEVRESSLGLARVASGQGLLDEAKSQYLSSLTVINAIQPHLELAQIYNQLGNTAEALRHLDEARKLEPNNPKILDFYIELSIVNGQPIEAQAALDVLKEANPDNQKIAGFARTIRELAQKLKPKKVFPINKVSSFGLTIKGRKK
ncbi:MAG: tetratricopeptide repeat protein [Candidatus Kerfeldbacteria bacterium]|nr:tetratricopeptide repeat protein [Candidatus Kerfeldbacteria bacterium]